MASQYAASIILATKADVLQNMGLQDVHRNPEITKFDTTVGDSTLPGKGRL